MIRNSSFRITLGEESAELLCTIYAMPRDNTRKVSHVTTQESVNIRDELRDAQLEWQKGFMFKTLGAVSIMIVILGVLLFGTNYYIQDYSGLSEFTT